MRWRWNSARNGSVGRIDAEFPKAPIKGVRGSIEPLMSAADLEREGKRQEHCVAVYISRVVAGTWYVYKVLHPERATLGLRRSADGTWQNRSTFLCSQSTCQ